MHAKYAKIVSDLAVKISDNKQNGKYPRDTIFLYSVIYPMIWIQMWKGYYNYDIVTSHLTPNIREILKKNGFVIRPKDSDNDVMTTVEWCDQTTYDWSGEELKVPSYEYYDCIERLKKLDDRDYVG